MAQNSENPFKGDKGLIEPSSAKEDEDESKMLEEQLKKYQPVEESKISSYVIEDVKPNLDYDTMSQTSGMSY